MGRPIVAGYAAFPMIIIVLTFNSISSIRYVLPLNLNEQLLPVFSRQPVNCKSKERPGFWTLCQFFAQASRGPPCQCQQFVQFVCVQPEHLSNTNGHGHGWRWKFIAFNFAQVAEREALHFVSILEAVLDPVCEFTLGEMQGLPVKFYARPKGNCGCFSRRVSLRCRYDFE